MSAPKQPHHRHQAERIDPAKLRPLAPGWLSSAAREVDQDLRNLAARYPHRFEFRDGKLHPRRS